MKNRDITKNYRTRFILNIVVSAFIVCLIESLLLFNSGRLMHFLTGADTTGEYESFTAGEVLLFVILGVVLFALIFYLLERASIRYIRSISRGVEQIADGNLEYRIAVNGDDEFSEMAESVNQMAGDLQGLLALERESERAKTELITNIAHDLRTPLTSVLGYLELVSGKNYDMLSDSQRRKYLKIAYTKAKRLEQLIGDLFDFTKLTYGKIAMKMGYVDLVRLLDQLLEESYPAFEAAGLKYELRSNVKSLEIAADVTLITRLFDNLIGNAIKYGKEGKRVIVTVHADEETDAVEVKVINFGFLIEEKDLPHIFEKFYRADKARSTQTGGTGLGLAIAKNITEMHGGTIGVTSDLKGTVFTVRLKIHFDRKNENFRRA